MRNEYNMSGFSGSDFVSVRFESAAASCSGVLRAAVRALPEGFDYSAARLACLTGNFPWFPWSNWADVDSLVVSSSRYMREYAARIGKQ